ncbi:hypothetical protein FQN60_005230, partial [Etheostoma spectabile]
MPQLNGADGDDLGANDELIAFKDEGEQEEKRNVSSGRDLDDVKSSLADRRPRTNPDAESRARQNYLFQEALRRQQDAGLFQHSPYVGYPFFMIPDLGNLCSPYLANGALPPSARTSNNVPVVQHPHMSHLHPLLSYSPEAFSPQRASPGFSPDAGMSRTPCYPVSPGGMAQIPHPLGWLQGQAMYPIAGGFSPAALAMNASMSGSADVHQEKEDERKPHIKKPLNAFMLYMREERPKVVAQCKVKESATINQILGQRWHSLSKEEQAKYYELARKERLLHSKLYPGWSARDNYGKKKKRKRAKSETQFEDPEQDFPLQLKRPRVPPDETPHTHAALLQQTAHAHTHAHTHGHTHGHTQPRSHLSQPHTVSHLTHTHLSQASPASSLDSPATPTTALASPGAPAPTHTEHAHTSTHSEHAHTSTHTEHAHTSTHTEHAHTSPYAEQLQPLSLTTRPHRTSLALSRAAVPSGPPTPTSSCGTPASSPHAAPPSRCSPPPPPAPTSAHRSAASSHGAFSQSQAFARRRTNQ